MIIPILNEAFIVLWGIQFSDQLPLIDDINFAIIRDV